MKNTDELLELIKQNPDLPVIPFVDPILCCDLDRRWKGSLGKARITEYTAYGEDIYFRDRLEDFKQELRVQFSWDSGYDDEIVEEQVQQYLDNLVWHKAIILDIDMPEVD